MKIFTVGALGLSSSKLSMLKQAFSFSVLVKRIRAYELIEEIGDTFPDMFLVNIENDEALQQWQKYKAEKGAIDIPFAAVTTKIPKKAKYQIRLPFYATRVLKVLDEITARELGFVPELTIDDNKTKEEVNLLDIKTIDQPVTKKHDLDEVIIAPASKHTVLIVDSNPSMQKILRLSLSLLKVDADCTSQGETALNLIQSNQYDAVFVEAELPEMSGYQICRAIRENPGNSKLPVIILTSKNKGTNTLRGKISDCTTSISRPISHKDLEAISQEYIFSG
jgi:twitching motility two-component system response regulator PilG